MRDIIVMGGSAGGIEALLSVVRSLPKDLPAAVFVVVHVPAYSVSRLPEILTRNANLPAAHAKHGERIQHGRIYIAPPDHHLVLRSQRVELSRGPRENHSRPAIDPLFRSAARAFGPRVTGVILSGALYDGAAGLLAVKGRGGTAIVQDPNEATVPSMPRSALRLVEVDSILPAGSIGDELTRLVREEIRETGVVTMIDDEERILDVIEEDFSELASNHHTNAQTVYTCPDCGGVMWQSGPESGGRFHCHVGHVYAPEVLLGQKSEEVEAALWACIRLLTEKATMTRQTAARTHAGGNTELSERIEEQAQLDERRAQLVRELLEAFPDSPDQTMTLLADIDAGKSASPNADD